MGDFIAIDTFPASTIPSLGTCHQTDFEDGPTRKDDDDDLVSTLLAMSFRDLDIPTPPSPPQVTLTFPDDWNCATARDVAQRLAGQSLYTPNYSPEIALRLQNKCKKIMPYLHRDICRDRLPTFSPFNSSGRPRHPTFNERCKLKTLEYLYAQRLQVAHLEGVKRASPAMWGYLAQLTAAISYDSQLWARVKAVLQPLDHNHLTLTFPPSWTCDTVEDVINHLTDSAVSSDSTPGGPAIKSLHQLPETKLRIHRDRLPIFSKGPKAAGQARKLKRLVKHQLLAIQWLYGEQLGVAHLNTMERECPPLFEYIGDLVQVVEHYKDQDAPTIVAALEGFTMANRNSHTTPHFEATPWGGGKRCPKRTDPTWTQIDDGFETDVDFEGKVAAVTRFSSGGAKRKLRISSSAPDILARGHSDPDSPSNSKRLRQKW